MGLNVNTNIQSLNAQRNLGKSQASLANSMQRLSSGLRINSAKDDAAGLAISDRMTAQIRGMNQAARNANDGISLAQTAEGALGEVTNMLQRMRELAIQSANGSNSTADRTALDAEFGQLIEEIDRIAADTQFNGKTLLDGTLDADFHIGANADQSINIAIDAADTNTLAGGDLNGASIASSTTANSAITILDDAINDVDTIRGDLGAIQNRFESTIANLNNVSENLSSARSRILDADIAQETSNMTKMNILQQAGVSILAQANQTPQLALSLLG
ncbi:MAG: flagellin [Syntrophotaleaceae bacterium]